MNHFSLGFLSLLLSPGWALAVTSTNDWGHAPTRLQLCQQEVQDRSGDERKRALRDCLVRRTQGEAGIAADCRRQLHIGTSGKRTAAQQRQLRDCEARALAVPSQQLPRRPVAPRPAVPAATTPMPASTRSPGPGARAVPRPVAVPAISVREGA